MGLNQDQPAALPQGSPARKPWVRIFWIVLGVTSLLWIATTLLYGWARAKGWQVYNQNNSGLKNGLVQSLAIDQQDRVWVGTANGLDVLIPKEGGETYTVGKMELTNQPVLSLAVDSQGQIWVGTDQGLKLFAPDGQRLTSSYNLTLSDRLEITTLTGSRHGPVYAGTRDFGLYAISSPGKEKHYFQAYLGLDKAITALADDSRETIYVGTSYGLSALVRDGSWEIYYAVNSGLISNKITSIVVDKQDQVWVGTNLGISMLAADGNWKTYIPENRPFGTYRISSLAIDSRDRVWAFFRGSKTGLSVFDLDGNWTTYTSKNSMLGSWCTSENLAIDSRDRIWLGCYRSVSVLDPAASVDPGIVDIVRGFRSTLQVIWVLAIVVGFFAWNKGRKARRALEKSRSAPVGRIPDQTPAAQEEPAPGEDRGRRPEPAADEEEFEVF
jgi:ligand-binding sensor domain-containing protein